VIRCEYSTRPEPLMKIRKESPESGVSDENRQQTV
jgi:hypothetical protein